MSTWIDIAETSAFTEHDRKVVEHQGQSILVLKLNDQYYAMDNQCTHQNFPLEEGDLEDGILTCPYHGAAFCVRTGVVKAAPAFEDLRTYPTRVEKGMVQFSPDLD